MSTMKWNGFEVEYTYDPGEPESFHNPEIQSSVEIISGELEDWDAFMSFLDEHKLIDRLETDLLLGAEESDDCDNINN